MPPLLYILLGAGLTMACCFAMGQLLFRRLGLRFQKYEQASLALVTGASLVHLIVFTLAAAGAVRKAVFYGLAAAILAAWWRWGKGYHGTPVTPLPVWWKRAFAAVYAVFAFVYLANSLAPEMSPDGSSYHLGLVARYLRDHGFSRITTNMYANLTQGIEMLYLFAFAIGRHSAAATVHCAFTLTLPFLMVSHARRAGATAAGLGGALLVFCSPLTGVDGTTCYNDVAAITILFAMYCLLEIWMAEQNHALLIPIGLLAGYAFASKYTIAVAVPYAFARVAWKLWRSRQRAMRPLAHFACAVAVMVVPWMAKNWIIVSNPLSPFFNRFFPNPYVRISFETSYMEQMRHYGDWKHWTEIPLEATARGGKLAGMLGPVFLLTPLALLAARGREGRRLLVAGAVFFLPFLNNTGARFLLPSLPFFSQALAMTLARAPAILPIVLAVHCVTSWPHVMREWAPWAWRIQRVPVAAALRITKEENYLTDRFLGYTIARMVEDFVPQGERVFAFSGVAEAYTSREILVTYQAGYNNMLGEMVYSALYPAIQPRHQMGFRFPASALRRVRVWQAASSGPGTWSINELRVYKGDKEVRRTPEWRVTAWPNHWDAALAVDNSIVTRWNTWEPLREGMFYEIDFGGPVWIDSLRIDCVNDQGEARLKLFGQEEKGPWRLVSGEPDQGDGPEIKAMRRAVIDEFRAQGIHYLLVADHDFGAEDFRLNGGAWGAVQLAERGAVRLYYLEGAKDP